LSYQDHPGYGLAFALLRLSHHGWFDQRRELQGIAGKSLNEIAGLEIAMLPAGEEGEAV
jgi:hypothetical protein